MFSKKKGASWTYDTPSFFDIAFFWGVRYYFDIVSFSILLFSKGRCL